METRDGKGVGCRGFTLEESLRQGQPKRREMQPQMSTLREACLLVRDRTRKSKELWLWLHQILGKR